MSHQELQLPKFPTMLRKMWSGREVQDWMEENLADVLHKARLYEHMLDVARANGFNSITEAITVAVKEAPNGYPIR